MKLEISVYNFQSIQDKPCIAHFAPSKKVKVIDSRLVADGNEIRRRRECLRCQERWTTYELAELVMPKIIKQDKSRVPFDETKLKEGIARSLEKDQ